MKYIFRRIEIPSSFQLSPTSGNLFPIHVILKGLLFQQSHNKKHRRYYFPLLLQKII